MTEGPIRLVLFGLGTAGQARLRACAAVEEITCVATVSRRPVADAVSVAAYRELLDDPSIDAVAIATENTDHAGRIEEALRAGKHVLCDYPVALSGLDARRLFALAEAQARTLWVEHIALLTDAHLEARRRALELGPLERGSFLFTGGWNAALADATRSGPFPIHVESRLVQLWDLFGPFEIAARESRCSPERAFFAADLVFAHGGTLRFIEERGAGLPRCRVLEARLAGGSLSWPESEVIGGLFAADLTHFRDHLLRGTAPYAPPEMLARVLELLIDEA